MRGSAGTVRGRPAIICEEDEEDCKGRAKETGDSKSSSEDPSVDAASSSPSSLPAKKNQVCSKNRHAEIGGKANEPCGPSAQTRKVCSLVQEDILSMSEDAVNGCLPDMTVFHTNEEVNLEYIVQKMRRECPELCKDKRKLVLQILATLSSVDD